MNISADYFIRGNNTGFESDMLLELINSMDKVPREAAIRMLREFIIAINYTQNKHVTDFPTPDTNYNKNIEKNQNS